MFQTKKKYFLAFVLLILLVFVRFFEKQLFNDALIDFFQYDYLSEALPKVSLLHIIMVDSMRFWINSLISIAILHLLFPQKDLLKFLFGLYGLVYFISILLFIYQLNHYQTGNYLGLFYVRRVLIQPLLLFILIPGLLFQKQKSH